MRKNNKCVVQASDIKYIQSFQMLVSATNKTGTEIARDLNISTASVSKLARWTPACQYGLDTRTVQAAKLGSLVLGKTAAELEELVTALENHAA